MKLPGELEDQAFIGETVIAFAPDNYVIEDLDHQEAGGPNQIFGQLSILRGGRRIARGVVVNEDEGCGLILQSQCHDFPGVDGTARETPQEHVLVRDQFIFPVEKKNLEHLPFQIPHGVKQVIENGLG